MTSEPTCSHDFYYDELGKKCRSCDMRTPILPTKPVVKGIEVDTPQFETFEEMYAWMEKQKANKAKPTSEPTTPVGKVYKVIHYYLRENDSYRALLRDAAEDRAMLPDAVLIKVHCHGFSDSPKLRPKCGPKCVKV